MAYSNFTFTKLKLQYGIEQESTYLFTEGITEIQPSQYLLDDIAIGKEMPLYSEKAKSEALIFPIIKELKRSYKHISIFSGYSLNIEGDPNLSGAPDFMVSAKPNIIEPQYPIFCLVESKNKAAEEGFAQCAAEMYAASLLNAQLGAAKETIYGAVTNAFDWIFLKLEHKIVYVDINRYYLNELPKLLGILGFIVQENKEG